MAHRFYYDLEILPYNFTNAFVNLEYQTVVVMVYNDDRYDYDYDAIHEQLQKAYPDFTVRPIMDMRDEKTLTYFIREFIGVTRKSEWFGWNSNAYDLIIMACMIAYYQLNRQLPPVNHLRKWSDIIIVDGKRSFKQFFQSLSSDYGYSEKLTKIGITQYRKLTATQLHVDVGALNEKSGEDASKSKFPFPLKVMQSYTGQDVIDDDLVKGDGTPSQDAINNGLAYESGALTTKGLTQLLIYNINDVISTGKLMAEPEYANALETRDTLRQEYPFLTKAPNEPGYIYQLPRDATSSKYAGKIIRGANEAKLEDIPAVSYQFPFPDGQKNALDFIEENEKNINPRIIEFYRHFEGRNTRTQDDYNLLRDSSLTGKSVINTPYVDKNGKATSAYITPSLGGSHGGVVNNTYGHHLYDPKDESFFRLFEDIGINSYVATVDVKNVIHVDFKSYYPTMNIILGVYKTGGFDNYADVRAKRYALKDMLTDELKAENPEKYEEIDRRQDALKLILNGATGASNQHKEWEDLPLDNATLSMRILGNLFIYTLGQRFSDKGGLVFSTNTDGLYVYGISLEDAQEVVDGFDRDFGLDLEPEIVNRMINKSANERIEIKENKDTKKLEVSAIGGKLNRSLKDRINLSSKIDYPRASGKAVISYIFNRESWLLEPIDMKYLKSLVVEQLDDFKPIDWTITLKGNSERHFYLEDADGYQVNQNYDNDSMFETNQVKLQNTNRIIMVKDGRRITQIFKGKTEKITGLTSTKVRVLNRQSELEDIQSYINDIDIESYVMWAYNILKTWYNTSVIPEVSGNEKELAEQMTLNDLF